MKSKALWFIGLIACVLVAAAVMRPAAQFDTVIRGGKVIDGTGKPAFRADVAIKNGKIAAVGHITGKGKTEINAKGKVVAPGFIDVHTHAENIEKLPLAENFVRMGVTTIVMGNCGSSEYPLGTFFRKLEKEKISVNIASFVGHNTLRARAMGDANRAPSSAEMEKMKGYVGQAMNDGAIGLSTGLIYLPGTYSKTDEIVELAKVVKKHNGMYVSHMRNEGLKIFDAIDELLTVGREAGVRCQLSHIKLSGNAMWGRSAEVLDKLDKARSEGIKVTEDLYAYTASSTGISQLIPDDKYLENGQEGFRKLISDPATKAQIVGEMKKKIADNQRGDYTYAVIASYAHDKTLNGLTIPQAAKVKFGKDDIDSQIEMVFEIYLNGGATGVFHGISEDDLRAFMKNPNTAIASDSSVRGLGEGTPHPRGYGNNARVLQTYVGQLKLLSLEEAIRKMTSLPAREMGIVDRGQVKVGLAADLVIFDPAKVKDNSTYTDPHNYATGFDRVLVNGVVTVLSDKHTKARSGKVLRSRNGAVRAG